MAVYKSGTAHICIGKTALVFESFKRSLSFLKNLLQRSKLTESSSTLWTVHRLDGHFDDNPDKEVEIHGDILLTGLNKSSECLFQQYKQQQLLLLFTT